MKAGHRFLSTAIVAAGLLSFAIAGQAQSDPEEKPKVTVRAKLLAGQPVIDPEVRAQINVRLRLLEIDVQKAMAAYKADLSSVEHFQAAVQRVAAAQVDPRGPTLEQTQRALHAAEQRLKANQGKLVELEVEKAQLLRRLGTKESMEPLDATEKLQRTLEKILEQVTNIDKRLEKLERRK
jgi:acyl-CoA reductase-like NAD-dependent aldehyde dehydrogenase